MGYDALRPGAAPLGLRAEGASRPGQDVVAVIESMRGARSVHEEPDILGSDVRIADTQQAKGRARLACKVDTVEVGLQGEHARGDLDAEIWRRWAAG